MGIGYKIAHLTLICLCNHIVFANIIDLSKENSITVALQSERGCSIVIEGFQNKNSISCRVATYNSTIINQLSRPENAFQFNNPDAFTVDIRKSNIQNQNPYVILSIQALNTYGVDEQVKVICE